MEDHGDDTNSFTLSDEGGSIEAVREHLNNAKMADILHVQIYSIEFVTCIKQESQ